MEKINFDVAIIGAGVAGMTAGIYLKRAGINCIIIEKEMYGGQINKAPMVENYPGYVKISGLELTTNIFEQVKKLGIEYITDEVVSVSSTEDEKIVNLKNKELKVKAIIIATGKKPRKLNVTNEEKLLGRGISYCATCDAALYKEREAIVIGFNEEALSEAEFLAQTAKKVYYMPLYNKDKDINTLQAGKDSLKDNIDIIKGKPLSIERREDKMVLIMEDRELAADGIFVLRA